MPVLDSSFRTFIRKYIFIHASVGSSGGGSGGSPPIKKIKKLKIWAPEYNRHLKSSLMIAL